MGMSASQVRFLSLQSRKNSIGRQLLTLSNRKMALSRDMNTVALRYNNALNQTTLKWSNDSGSTYNALSYDLMMQPNDINAEKPYIVTKATTGEVVLNNDVLKDFNGNAIKDAKTGQDITYVEIAQMISKYSGLNSNGTCQYNNTNAINSERKNGVDSITGGKKAIDNAYYIPSGTYDYSYDNSLRYEIFQKMGLITDADRTKQLELLNKLYGSKEALNAQCYPVDCAWGKYYIAVANRDAYDNYTKNFQNYADANTFGGSNKTSEQLTYNNSKYNYNYDIVGVDSGARADSNTQITQKAYSTSATSVLSHIDFTTATGSTSESHTSTKGTTLTTTLTQDGITYQYKLDDIWENAKKMATQNGSSLGDDINHVGQGESGLREIASSGKSSLDLSGVKSKLNSYIDGFIGVLKLNSIVDLDDNILNKAKTQTSDYFYDNRDGGYDGRSGLHRGSRKAANKARSRALNHNHIGVSRYGGVHSASRAYVDLSTLFNTFMTFYSQLSAGQNTDIINSNSKPQMNIDENSFGDTPSSTGVSQANGKWFYDETYTDRNNTKIVNSYELSTSKPSNYDSSSLKDLVFVYDTTTNKVRKYTGSADDGLQKYYINCTITNPGSTDDENPEDITFGNEKSLTYSNNATTWDEDQDPSTTNKNIYATLEIDDSLYYFESYADVQKYLNNGDMSGAKLYQERTLGNSTSDIALTGNASSSKYGISISARPKEDSDMKSYLDDKVNEAYDYIKELQDEIDNLYSSADKKIMDYYDAVFQRIAENGWIVDDNTSRNKTTSSTYLNNKLQNNDYFVTECESKADSSGYNYTTKMASSIHKIYQVHDDNAENEALVEYETEKSAISAKESKIDVIMQKLETEQEAINTTMESVQKIIQENIEKTFKMFA